MFLSNYLRYIQHYIVLSAFCLSTTPGDYFPIVYIHSFSTDGSQDFEFIEREC